MAPPRARPALLTSISTFWNATGSRDGSNFTDSISLIDKASVCTEIVGYFELIESLSNLSRSVCLPIRIKLAPSSANLHAQDSPIPAAAPGWMGCRNFIVLLGYVKSTYL